jgi:hypothetical protein
MKVEVAISATERSILAPAQRSKKIWLLPREWLALPSPLAILSSVATLSAWYPTQRAIAVAISFSGPSRHIALPHELGRYRGKADVAFVASRGRVYGYTA